MRRIGMVGMLAGGVLVLASGVASAQRGGGGTGGGFGSGGTGGGIGSGGTGGSFGSGAGGGSGFGSGAGGGSTFGSGFGAGSGSSFGGAMGGSGFGATSGTFGSGAGASFGGGGAAMGFGGRPGGGGFTSASPFARFSGTPYAAGLVSGNVGAASSLAAQNVRAYPGPLTPVGQPIYGTALVTTTANQGATGLGAATGMGGMGVGGVGGVGGAGGVGGMRTTTGAAGAGVVATASSAGLRRAPAYYTEPVFDTPSRPSITEVRSDVQAVIARSSRLPSRDSIRVTTSGDTIILRGQVRDQRERRLAEALVRLSPGVRQVRNELEPRR